MAYLTSGKNKIMGNSVSTDDNVVTIIDDTCTDEQVPSALGTKTYVDDLFNQIDLTTYYTKPEIDNLFATSGGGSSEKQIKDWVSCSSYLEGDYIYHEGEIYRCLSSNSDVDFDEYNWEQLTYGIDELSKEDVEGLLGLTEEEIETMANLIADTEVRLDKTYSSSKIYTDIQQCLEDSKTYTLEELSKFSRVSYKIVTSTSEMTSESIIYLLANGNTYDMYVIEENGAITKIGDTNVNLSDYYTKTEIAKIETELKGNIEELNNSLVDKRDFRIFKSLEEFNEKKGTSFTVVSGVDNMLDITKAMSEGDMLIITTKYTTGSEIYFGLDSSTGWTKMFTFIKANGLCDVECRTTSPSTFKRVLNTDSVVGAWQQLATTVAGVGVTTITPVNSNITGTIEYTVKNGICYVSMKDLMSKISSSSLSISTTMPKPSINVNTISVSSSGNVAKIYINKGATYLIGDFYQKNVPSSCLFSYPVAE